MILDHNFNVTLEEFFKKYYDKYKGEDVFNHYILIKFPGSDEYMTLKYLFTPINEEVYKIANLYLSQPIKEISLLLADGSRGIYITM